MSDGMKCCICTVQIINILVAATAISLVALVYNGTKDNPLENLEDKIHSQTPKSSLKTSPSFQLLNEEEKYCQCGEEILNNICTEEQIISGCYDISKYKEKSLLRNLEDEYQCDEINAHLNAGEKMNVVFDIGYGQVHKMALGILICMGVILGLDIILSLVNSCSDGSGNSCVKTCSSCNSCISAVGGLAEFVLVIILLVNFYKGRTTGEFLDYHDYCTIPSSYKDNFYFNEAYDKMKKVYTYMTALIIMNFASFGLTCVLTCCVLLVMGKMSQE